MLLEQLSQLQQAAAAGDIRWCVCPCCAPAAAGYFHKQDAGVFLAMMQLNYLGCVHAAKAVAAEMLGRDSGHLCFVCSAMGLLGGWWPLLGRACPGPGVDSQAPSICL
jgi:short-subunit dehydrogenase